MELTARRVLPIILAVFAVLALIYSSVTRLKWAPDEPAHFIYIRSLALDHTPPPISHGDTPTEKSKATHEGHQPPLYYALMAIPFAILHAFGVSNDTIWRVLRLLDVPIGLLWMCSVFALAREYFGRDKPALATTAFVALIPTASYMAGVINNEALISLLFTTAMLPILRFFRTGCMASRSAAYLGLVMGLAILTKAQSLILVPMLLLAAIAACRRAGYTNWSQVARSTGIVLGVAALVSGWWFVRCWLVHGSPIPRSLTVPMLAGGGAELLVAPIPFVILVWQLTTAAYVYFCLPFWVIWDFVGSMMGIMRVLLAVTIVVFAGLLMRLRRGGVDVRALGFLLLAPVLVWIGWLRYMLFIDKWANLQGRLFLSVAAVGGIVWILGFDGLLEGDKAKKIGAVAGYALMLAANAWVISCAARLYH